MCLPGILDDDKMTQAGVLFPSSQQPLSQRSSATLKAKKKLSLLYGLASVSATTWGITVLWRDGPHAKGALLSCKPLDQCPPRVLRFRLRLMPYGFKINHIPGKELAATVALSLRSNQRHTRRWHCSPGRSRSFHRSFHWARGTSSKRQTSRRVFTTPAGRWRLPSHR